PTTPTSSPRSANASWRSRRVASSATRSAASNTGSTDEMIGFVVFSVRRAWQGFWRNALMSLAATATMVLMLLLLAGFWILQAGLQAGLEYTESKVEVVADLKDTATPTDVTDIEGRLRLMPEVK